MKFETLNIIKISLVQNLNKAQELCDIMESEVDQAYANGDPELIVKSEDKKKKAIRKKVNAKAALDDFLATDWS